MKQFGGIELGFNWYILMVVGGPGVVVREGPLGKAKWIPAVTVGDFWINYVTGIVSFIEQLWGS